MTLRKIIFVILVFFLPAVLVGYVNWDITYITGGFLLVSIFCSFITALTFSGGFIA